MKALLRSYNGESLVYVDVKFANNKFYFKDDKTLDYRITEWNIIDVAYDNRDKYVICSNCGKMIKNTPEAIEDHWKEEENKKNCMKCRHCIEKYPDRPFKKSYEYDPETQMYIATSKYTVNLVCNAAYHYRTINTALADENCIYLKCKNASKIQISDMFTEYPHAFNILPTVDMLVGKRWKFVEVERLSGHLIYCHPSMKTLKAYVNNKGIISYFQLRTGDSISTFMYSSKYDKVFYRAGERYGKEHPWNLSESRRESAFNKVKELFDEVN